jgi:hypothetical protein
MIVSNSQWPPLWSSDQSFWLQTRRPWFDSRHYQKKKVVGLERGPLSLVSTTEELLDRQSSGSCLENREYGRRDPSHWPRGTLYLQKLAITSPTSDGRSVSIVRSRTQTMEFVFLFELTVLIKETTVWRKGERLNRCEQSCAPLPKYTRQWTEVHGLVVWGSGWRVFVILKIHYSYSWRGRII